MSLPTTLQDPPYIINDSTILKDPSGILSYPSTIPNTPQGSLSTPQGSPITPQTSSTIPQGPLVRPLRKHIVKRRGRPALHFSGHRPKTYGFPEEHNSFTLGHK